MSETDVPVRVGRSPVLPVADLAYGTIGLDARSIEAEALLESIDAETLVGDGTTRSAVAVWTALLAEIGTALVTPGGSFVLGVPSFWGRVRTAVVDEAARRSGYRIVLVPRAVLIAASHSDVLIRRCAVVETTHLPVSRRRPASDVAITADLTVVGRGSGGGWEIERRGTVELDESDAVELDESGAVGLDESNAVGLDDSVHAVYVDGHDRAEVDQVRALLGARLSAVRVIAADRELTRRLGARALPAPVAGVRAPQLCFDPPVHAAVRSPRGRVVASAVAFAVVIGSILAVPRILSGTSSAEGIRIVTVDPVQVSVPGGWQRSTTPLPSSGADRVPRSSVFAAPTDGRRIIVTTTALRAGASAATVASSLANRIAARGTDDVAEFSASMTYAGREVIGYREHAGSGGPISWYVLVEGGWQISVGCQGGDQGESVEPQCRAAVGSLAMAEE